MTQQSPEVEILVHIAAPSRVSDDISYRNIANAYLGFEAAKRTNVLASPEVPAAEARSPRQDAFAERSVAVSQSQGAFFVDSQSMSFQSVYDNRASPRVWPLPKLDKENVVPSSHRHHDDDSPSGVESSWDPPPSEISDSYPMPPRLQPLVSPSRVFQQYLTCSRESLLSPSVNARSARRANAAPVLAGESFRDESVSSLALVTPQHMQSNTSFAASSLDEESRLECASPPASTATRSIVPVTPQVPQQHRIPRGKEAVDAEEDIGPDVTHISGSDLSRPFAASSFRAGSEPPPSKRPRTSQLAQSSELKALIRSSSDTVATNNDRKPSPPLQPPQTPTPARSSQALEIVPPSPPVGIADLQPEDLVSSKLADIARTLSTRYRATHARSLEPFERGYWSIDCSSWSAQVKADAWSFLTDYLGSGLAGWGVWCRRDRPGDEASWVKLFCWGHIAKHMYLLLYLASGRHMKFTGAEWRDAEGEVIVTVPAIAKAAAASR